MRFLFMESILDLAKQSFSAVYPLPLCQVIAAGCIAALSAGTKPLTVSGSSCQAASAAEVSVNEPKLLREWFEDLQESWSYQLS